MTITVNKFVQRQTSDSRFSHFLGSFDKLISLVEENWKGRIPGDRSGAWLVSVPESGFYSGVVSLKHRDTLIGGYAARKEGEHPRKFISAMRREKIPAKSVEIVVYESYLLAEDGDNSLPVHPENYEIISINASPEAGPTPIAPETLIHNHFGSDGGTDTMMTAAEFECALRESFNYWKDKAMCG